MATVASQSKEGEIIAQMLKKLKYKVVRGSSSRGGVKALVGMKNYVKNGHDVAFTVDGPKGPKYSVKPGVILAAKKNDGALIPAFMNCKRVKRFNSWDKLILPLPFAKIKVTFAPPMLLSPDTDQETIEHERKEFEKYMMGFTDVFSPDIV